MTIKRPTAVSFLKIWKLKDSSCHFLIYCIWEKKKKRRILFQILKTEGFLCSVSKFDDYWEGWRSKLKCYPLHGCSYLVTLHLRRFHNLSTTMRINFVFWFTALCLSGGLFFYPTPSGTVWNVHSHFWLSHHHLVVVGLHSSSAEAQGGDLQSALRGGGDA